MKSVAASADLLQPNRPGIVVLCYHRVGERSDAHEIDLPRQRFAAQMAEIAGRAIALDNALDALEANDVSRRYDVVVTFDDGTVDFVEDALPVLVEFRVPAVLYVASAHIDEQRDFPQRGRPLSWSALRDAHATGLVTIASHTHTHALLDRCDRSTIVTELDRSIALIGDHIGVAPAHFAYPKAVLGNADAEQEVRARFRSAAVAGTRANRFGATNPFRLARSPIQRSDDMRWFRHKLNGGMRLEDDVRRIANRLRYAGATS